ncbi:MAG TPA: MoaD/ThiS family protein [Sporichthya sp.]|nr:MoaD/ThiS family protein [Sporichthya sp.]
MAHGTIHYWASAKAAAGTDSEPYDAETLGEALDAARAARGPDFARVIGVCSFVVDSDPVGTRDHAEVKLPEGGVVEVLPPFAGG